MTQVGQKRGGQPFYPISGFLGGSVRHNAPQFSGAEQLSYPIARVAKQQTWNKLSVGGRVLNRFTDMLVPLFQRITEVYIIGFVMQDVIGMWVPRIGTSLKVGRVPYDPSQDADAKDKPFKEQIRLWMKGNVQGLNWVNFQEETAREAATGPGLLVIPSIMYAFGSRAVSKSGIHLRYSALNGLCEGFNEHLKASSLAQAGSELKLPTYRKAMGDYIATLFNDPDMRKTHMASGETYEKYLEQWSQRWANAMEMGGDKASRKKQDAALANLSKELQEKLTAFNQEHRMKAYEMDGKTIGSKATDSLLNRADHTWVSYSGKGQAAQMPMGQLMTDLTKWTDVSRAIFKTQTEKLAGITETKLPEVVEFVRRKVVSHKALFGVSTTLLGIAYLFQLVFLTQRHKSYQATRLLHEAEPSNGGKAGETKAGGSHPAPTTSGNVPPQPQAYMNSPTQPAFPLNVPGQRPVFDLMSSNARGMRGGQPL